MYMEIYKCNVCKHIVEIIHEGIGQLVCCDQPMKLINSSNEDAGKEKHLPVVEKNEKGIKVKIGSVEHPMLENHFIEWIEIIADGHVYRKTLEPGMPPEGEFCIKGTKFSVRSYCNVHGLWETI